MKNYVANVNTVLEIMRRYHYSERILTQTRVCFTKLKPILGFGKNRAFSAQVARKWCESSAADWNKAWYLDSVDYLEDVYLHGRILGKHLKIRLKFLSGAYADLIDSYIKTIRQKHTIGTINVIRTSCVRFCCFLQCNNISEASGINYTVLNMYAQYLDEAYVTRREWMTADFLYYLYQNGYCRRGHYLFMRYKVSATKIFWENLPESIKVDIDNLRKDSLSFTLDEFYDAILNFRAEMVKARYSNTAINGMIYYLKVFYIFLDMANLGYAFGIIDILLSEKLFGRCLKSARRALDMFEDYAKYGFLVPEHRRKHAPNSYDLLPQWCKDAISLYLNNKKKEGLSNNSIYTLRGHTIRFCKFLVSTGITSFKELTPYVIKNFNIQDQHDTIYSKNNYNATIRSFIMHMEFKNMVQHGLSNALPKCANTSSRIVKTLTDTDKRAIETYCTNAKTPIQIRDAAIILIGLTTGMRPIDILGLKKDNVSLKDLTISFTQHKTGVSQTVAIDVITANAIVKYVRDVRPQNTGYDHIFLTIQAPYTPLCSYIGLKSLHRVGVSTDFRTLRRNFATERANAGATVEEVAYDLGHRDTGTVHRYVSLDEKRMRLCSQSLDSTGLVLNDGRYNNV